MKRNTQPEIKAAIDQRLEDVVSKANYRITLNNQLQNARLKNERALIYSINGGLFSITPELISFTQALTSLNQEDAVILDNNANPIHIQNLKEFQSAIVAQYYEVMNEFLLEFKSIRANRSTATILGD